MSVSKYVEKALAADREALEKKKATLEQFAGQFPTALEILSRTHPEAALCIYSGDVLVVIPEKGGTDSTVLSWEVMNQLENLCDTDLSKLIELEAVDITYKDDRKRYLVYQACIHELIKAGGIINL